MQFKWVLPLVLLVLFWCWESWRPFMEHGPRRWRHGLRNLSIAILNTTALAVSMSVLTAWVAAWAEHHHVGLLHSLAVPAIVQWAVALVVLDGWMYLWHRANHQVPLLWRFHRMHHSDQEMDVTTATRFHLGEHIGSAILRLGVIALVGISLWQIVTYELLVIAITQFHHANISIGRLDSWLRLLIVTPDMHKVHHSQWRPETDSNYATLFSFWDRAGRSFRMRQDVATVEFGLRDFGAAWQTVWGMLRTPFVLTGSRTPPPLPPTSETRALAHEELEDARVV